MFSTGLRYTKTGFHEPTHCSVGTSSPGLRKRDSPCISVEGFKDSNNYVLITTGGSKDINIVNSIAEVGNYRQH